RGIRRQYPFSVSGSRQIRGRAQPGPRVRWLVESRRSHAPRGQPPKRACRWDFPGRAAPPPPRSPAHAHARLHGPVAAGVRKRSVERRSYGAASTAAEEGSMSATRAKKVKMATKSCPECDQQIPVACKSCPCGYIFISRKLLNAKHSEKSPSSTENKHEAKRRRTERVRREKINSTVNKDLENRKRSRSNSHSDHIRRGRGRPKSTAAKKHEEEREKQEKEIDIYANLSDEKAFVFSVALAEINRKIINQRLIL
ncbi:UPF0547 protein C16orf87 homolog, partial [Lemmus lemmus]